MSESVVLDVQMNSPIDRVWQALTDSAALSRWMMFKRNTFKPELGHTFQFRDAPGYDGVIDCTVTELDAPRSLTYTWETEGQDGQRHATVVAFTLQDAGNGTTNLHLKQSGFRKEATQELGGAMYGWQMMLDQLQAEVSLD